MGEDCDTFGIAAHEIGHALGLWHEQSRSDRGLIFTYFKYQSKKRILASDNYIKVLYDNVQESKLHNFDKKNVNTFGLPYDYASDMHYGRGFFKKFANLNTIETIDPDYQKTIGSSIDLSFLDIKAINLAYCSSNYYFNTNILSIIFMVYLKPHARILWPVNEMDT
jgi:astacin